ncbi:MAG: MoxR family ATPase [Candidatus Bathyarchaeia archaeon]
MSLKKSVLKLKEEVKARFVGNEEVVDIVILNQLHRRSSTLIRAQRGVGKSTLMLLILRGITGEDYVVISGASEVKRGEVVGRLHIPSLEKEGVEKVLWAAFVQAKGKGIDEVNRLNPYTTSNIHHMMQFGEVWAYGQRVKVGDYVLLANENPADPTTFIHPPPFYDRFDICVYLSSLSLSDKFKLQSLLESYEGELVESMPQVLTFEELQSIRREVEEVELDSETVGLINMLVRDFQACVRGREHSEVKPPILCEGCHFLKDVCSNIKDPPSERSTIVLTQLVKAKSWLEGKASPEDALSLSLWVFPHRMNLVKTRSLLNDLRELLMREKVKMDERVNRRQWLILSKLMNGFDRGLYTYAREVAVEDPIFAEELMKLEKTWVKEGILREEDTLGVYLRWR